MDEVCDRCRFGRISTTTACYVGKLGTLPIVMPSLPAYSCDICGWIEYDAAALKALDTLIQQPEPSPKVIRPQQAVGDVASTIVSVK